MFEFPQICQFYIGMRYKLSFNLYFTTETYKTQPHNTFVDRFSYDFQGFVFQESLHRNARTDILTFLSS